MNDAAGNTIYTSDMLAYVTREYGYVALRFATVLDVKDQKILLRAVENMDHGWLRLTRKFWLQRTDNVLIIPRDMVPLKVLVMLTEGR